MLDSLSARLTAIFDRLGGKGRLSEDNIQEALREVQLARLYAKQGQHPILAAADVYRPAAQDQLKTLGAQLDVPVVGDAGRMPVEICRAALETAAERGLTPLILDTAGRLHIDETMLDE